MYNTINITVVDAEDIGFNFVMGKVFYLLHTNYFPTKNGNVGVTFPKIHKKGVGDTLKLYSKDELCKRELSKVLRKFEEYLHIGKVRQEDTVTGIRKVDTKSKGKLIRRCVKRKGVSEEVAEEMYSEYKGETKNLPYLVVKSKSTGQRFSMFFEECENSEKYNSYGLCLVSV